MSEETPKRETDESSEPSAGSNEPVGSASLPPRVSGGHRVAAAAIPRPVAAFAPRGAEVAPDSGWTPGTPAVEAVLAASVRAPASLPEPSPSPSPSPPPPSVSEIETPKQSQASTHPDGQETESKESTPPPSSQAEGARSRQSILAMRIVRIEGASGRPPPPPLEPREPEELDSDAVDSAPPDSAPLDSDPLHLVPHDSAARVSAAREPEVTMSERDEHLEELADDDIEERLSRPEIEDDDDDAPESAFPDSRADLPSSRRPPPRRQRSQGPPVPPSARAVEKALKASRFDPSKKRGRLWWEELFTDDFGRAIPPLGEPQLRKEVDFIERSLGVTQEGIVLDLACGTGHHAVEFASRGYSVVGYDLSVSQLAEASERAQERGLKINFLQGDMRELAFENTFDGIYCWNTSFGYFEEEKNIHLARRVFHALKSGGSFLLDVINRDFAVVQQPNQNWFEGDGCVCMDDMNVDFITSRLRVKRTVMLDDGRTRECNYSVRLYGLHELGKILHDIGFKVIQASGHPAVPGVFFGAQSPRVIILAAKP